MNSIQASDPLPESNPLPGNRNSTEQEIYELGEAQKLPATSDETSHEGQTYLTQEYESLGEDGIESPGLNENEGSIRGSNGELAQGGTQDRAKTGDESTPLVGTQGAMIQEWSFDPSATRGAAPDRRDITVHQACGLDDFRNDTPSLRGDSGATTLPISLPNTETTTLIHRGRTPAASATRRGATGSADPSIPSDHTSSGVRTVPGFTPDARTSPQPQSRSYNLSSSLHSRTGTGFSSNDPSRTGQRPQRPGGGFAEHTSNMEPSIRNALSGVENALITLTNQITALEQKVNNTLTTNLTNQVTQNKLDVIAIDSQSSSISLTKIAGILEHSNNFQETIIENFRSISEAVSGYNNNLKEAQKICVEVNARMLNYATGLASFGMTLDDFKHAWDVNRRLVNSYQEVILSLVSWLEPTALFFRNIGRVFGFLAFWQGSRSWKDYILPLAAGNQDDVDEDDSEEIDGNEVHLSGDIGIQGAGQGGNEGAGERSPSTYQEYGGQQPSGNQAAAQPVPGQYGSPFRADGFPWDTYNSRGGDTPITTTTKHNSLKEAMRMCWSYFLLLVFLLCIIKLIIPSPLHFWNGLDTTPQEVKAAASARGAYPIEPVMIALFETQNEARAVAELASQSAENVVVCANLARNVSHERVWFLKNWHGKMKMDPEGKCMRAVSLSTKAALKVKMLAIRLEWVFGEKWWVTAEGKAGKTEMGINETDTAVIWTTTSN